MTKDEFIVECKNIGIEVSGKQLQSLEKYKELLIEWNKKFNLTSILEDGDIYLKHFYDSLCLSRAVMLDSKLTLCDFGTGAGFPGMILAIFFDKLIVELIESSGKKVTFLNIIKETLGLNNVRIIQDRMEDYCNSNRERYDIVTCRAVSNLGIISELSIAALKNNGLFVPLKSDISDELSKYINGIQKLGYKFEKSIEYTLPIENSKRTIPVLRKTKATDSIYPRSYNIIITKYK